MIQNLSIKTYTLSDELKEGCLDKVRVVLERHAEIIFAYAFGSFLADLAFRDLDIAVYVGLEVLPSVAFRYEDSLAQEISAQLDLPCPVDLRVLNDAPVPFQFHVFRGRLLVDRNPELRFAKLTHIATRYLDIRQFLKHYLREAYGRA
jgi:predicted nucleotidyltransferase